MSGEKKYLLRPGFVVSKTDGDWHFISVADLIRLYKVDPNECVTSDLEGNYLGNLIELTPRFDGNYQINKRTNP